MTFVRASDDKRPKMIHNMKKNDFGTNCPKLRRKETTNMAAALCASKLLICKNECNGRNGDCSCFYFLLQNC